MIAIAALVLAVSPIAPAAPQPWERCPQWEPLIAAEGLPVRMFSFIAWRESRCLPKVIGENAPGVRPDYGLFQINGTWVTLTSQVCRAKYGNMKVLLKPSCNVKVAAFLYAHGGKYHWKGSSRAWDRANGK